MTRGKAEDAGGLTPAKDDNAAPYHFDRRTLPIFKCVDYIRYHRPAGPSRGPLRRAVPVRDPRWKGGQPPQNPPEKISCPKFPR